MNAEFLAARPVPFQGSRLTGPFGVWTLPPPPPDSVPRQHLDHAAVVGFGMAYHQFASSHLGVLGMIEASVKAYLESYYSPEEVEAAFEPNIPTESRHE